MSRAYDTDRELLLLAYEQITPPRNAAQDALREALLRAARAILDRDAKPQNVPPPNPRVRVATGSPARKQMRLPGVDHP